MMWELLYFCLEKLGENCKKRGEIEDRPPLCKPKYIRGYLFELRISTGNRVWVMGVDVVLGWVAWHAGGGDGEEIDDEQKCIMWELLYFSLEKLGDNCKNMGEIEERPPLYKPKYIYSWLHNRGRNKCQGARL
jgi:hypothetical protein